MIWSELSQPERLKRVNELSAIRRKLLLDSKKNRLSKGRKTTKRKTRQIQFKNKELEDTFHKMPAEMQKWLQAK